MADGATSVVDVASPDLDSGRGSDNGCNQVLARSNKTLDELDELLSASRRFSSFTSSNRLAVIEAVSEQDPDGSAGTERPDMGTNASIQKPAPCQPASGHGPTLATSPPAQVQEFRLARTRRLSLQQNSSIKLKTFDMGSGMGFGPAPSASLSPFSPTPPPPTAPAQPSDNTKTGWGSKLTSQLTKWLLRNKLTASSSADADVLPAAPQQRPEFGPLDPLQEASSTLSQTSLTTPALLASSPSKSLLLTSGMHQSPGTPGTHRAPDGRRSISTTDLRQRVTSSQIHPEPAAGAVLSRIHAGARRSASSTDLKPQSHRASSFQVHPEPLAGSTPKCSTVNGGTREAGLRRSGLLQRSGCPKRTNSLSQIVPLDMTRRSSVPQEQRSFGNDPRSINTGNMANMANMVAPESSTVKYRRARASEEAEMTQFRRKSADYALPSQTTSSHSMPPPKQRPVTATKRPSDVWPPLSAALTSRTSSVTGSSGALPSTGHSRTVSFAPQSYVLLGNGQHEVVMAHGPGPEDPAADRPGMAATGTGAGHTTGGGIAAVIAVPAAAPVAHAAAPAPAGGFGYGPGGLGGAAFAGAQPMADRDPEHEASCSSVPSSTPGQRPATDQNQLDSSSGDHSAQRIASLGACGSQVPIGGGWPGRQASSQWGDMALEVLCADVVIRHEDHDPVACLPGVMPGPLGATQVQPGHGKRDLHQGGSSSCGAKSKSCSSSNVKGNYRRRSYTSGMCVPTPPEGTTPALAVQCRVRLGVEGACGALISEALGLESDGSRPDSMSGSGAASGALRAVMRVRRRSSGVDSLPQLTPSSTAAMPYATCASTPTSPFHQGRSSSNSNGSQHTSSLAQSPTRRAPSRGPSASCLGVPSWQLLGPVSPGFHTAAQLPGMVEPAE